MYLKYSRRPYNKQMYTHTSWQGDRIDITVNQIHPALTHPKATKCYKGESRKFTKFDYVIEGGLTYGHQIVARAVTPEWHAAGGQCFVVRQVPAPGLNSRETLLFWLLPFRGDSLEMKGEGSFKEVRVKVSWEVLQTGASSVPCDRARGRASMRRTSELISTTGLYQASSRAGGYNSTRFWSPIANQNFTE